jgi:integrase/ribosomal protein L40E
MAIQIFCSKCKSTYGLDAKSCFKCGASFGRDKKYRVCVSVKGQRVTRVVDNLTIARETEAAIKGDMVRGEFEINRNVKQAPTLGEVWAKYLLWAKEHKKTWDDDLGNYKKHLEPPFGKKRLNTISSMDVNRLKLAMTKGETKDGKLYLSKRGKLFSASTIKHQLVLLHRLYNFGQGPDFKYKGATPFDHKQVVMPHLGEEPPRFLTNEQLAALWNTLDTWPDKMTVGFIKFALFTGVRRGTLFPLKWSDIDFNWNMVTLMISHRRKGIETVIKTVCPEAMEVLKALPRTSDYVFPGRNNGQKTDFKGPWRRVRKAAGLPDTIRFHDLRHTFGSYHAMNGTDLQIIQQLMNHRDYRTTLKYAHLSESVVSGAAAKSGELLTPKGEAGKVINLNED